MDAGDYFWLALVAWWLYQQVAEVARRHRERQRELDDQAQQALEADREPTRPSGPRRLDESPEPAQRIPAPPPARGRGPGLAERLRQSLTDLDHEIERTLAEIDAPVRAQVAYLVETDYAPKAEALRRELRDEASPELARAGQEAQWLMSHYREALQTARVHSGLRQRPELVGVNTVADALATELNQPRNVSHPLPPPVGIVWDVSSGDRPRESALADATLFVPRTVTEDPSHWSLAAPETARYLSASAPSLYQDIYRGLELGAAEAQVGTDPESLTRVLFASWIGRIVSDAVGALLFGPSYLLSIAKLYAQPGAPARVTSIVLNRDGTVHVEPPAHVRVHLAARWVTRMGYASEAAAIRRAWDEEHGSPEVLGFWGSMTSLPAAPVLETAAQLVDNLFQLPLDAFGKIRLAHLPGISGWESHARQSAAARSALGAGERATGSVRALIAGAIEAALNDPGANPTIHRALITSFGTAPAVIPKPAAPRRPVPPRPSARVHPFGQWSGRDVAEALILGEILLEPRSRPR